MKKLLSVAFAFLAISAVFAARTNQITPTQREERSSRVVLEDYLRVDIEVEMTSVYLTRLDVEDGFGLRRDDCGSFQDRCTAEAKRYCGRRVGIHGPIRLWIHHIAGTSVSTCWVDCGNKRSFDGVLSCDATVPPPSDGEEGEPDEFCEGCMPDPCAPGTQPECCPPMDPCPGQDPYSIIDDPDPISAECAEVCIIEGGDPVGYAECLVDCRARMHDNDNVRPMERNESERSH